MQLEISRRQQRQAFVGVEHAPVRGSTKSKRPPCDFLAEQIMEDLQRRTGQAGDA